MGRHAPARRQKVYTIQPHICGDFSTGFTSDGRQVLMGLLYPNITAVFFDDDGRLIEVQERRIPFDPPPGYPHSFAPGYAGVASKVEKEWKAEIGFGPSTIRVRVFDRGGIKVRDRPDDFECSLADPEHEESDEVRRALMVREVEAWDRSGRFVMHWGKEYRMKPDGTVHST